MERESGLILPPGVELAETWEPTGRDYYDVSTRWGRLQLEVAGMGRPLMLFYRGVKGRV